MADAQASGACGRKIVWVQVPSPALFFCSFHVTVHSVHSNLVKIHSKSPSVMGFCPVCLGILPVNSSLYFSIYMSELLHLFLTDKGFICVRSEMLYRIAYRKAGNISLCKIFPAFLRLLKTITIDRLINSCCLTDFTDI